MINKYTPLSRIQKRLEQWKETLRIRLAVKNEMLVGQIAVSFQGDKALDSELVEQARAAIKDWEAVVRMVSVHEELLEALKRLETAARDVANDAGEGPIDWRVVEDECSKASAAIAKAEGRD